MPSVARSDSAPSAPPGGPPVIAVRGRATCRVFWPDHLGWFALDEPLSGWCRLAAGDVRGPELLTSPGLSAPSGQQPELAVLTMPAEARAPLPPELRARLARLSPLVRVGTPSVWEATATAVLRQVIHRDQARVVFARVCEMFGAPAFVGGQLRHAFPTPEAVLAREVEELRRAGIGFKAKTLRTLAEWSLDSRAHLQPPELYEELLAVPGIGPWTAAVAVCDFFSDYSWYPVDDLAVRARANAVWPEVAWPAEPAAFAAAWREQTAPYTAAVTAFVLADAVLSGA